MTSSDFFNIVQDQLDTDLPFVVYKKPQDKQIGLYLQNNDQLKLVKSFEEQGFVFAPFDNREKTILIPGSPEYCDDFDFESVDYNSKPEATNDTSDKEEHITLVTMAVQEIKNTDLQKVVLSRKQAINAENFDAIEVFKKLGSKYTSAFVYLWHHPKVGTWLGATPETLLSIKGRSFETMALAGTQAYQDSLEVSWGVKEQEEQQLVTDEIVARLEPFRLNKFKIYPRETYKAGNLLHLRTRITGDIIPQEHSVKGLLEALHPTPAVCGFPRDSAKQFILKNENYNRSFYTGFLGELNILKDNSKRRNPRNVENLAYKTLTKSTQLYVNLRCMNYDEGRAIIYIGGGITKDSNAESEWFETENKAQTIASIL